MKLEFNQLLKILHNESCDFGNFASYHNSNISKGIELTIFSKIGRYKIKRSDSVHYYDFIM